ncbi:MAG: trigger factor [Vicinamibacterales bacterium]
MKTEFVDVNETRKNLTVEIPSEVVDAEIDRLAREYSRRARIPGFRPGKAPSRVIKQRFKDQILHDLAHDLIPRAVDEALRERGVEAVDTPDIRDVNVEAGRALTFTASFDTLPPFDPGDLSTISLRRTNVAIGDDAVAGAIDRLRDRAGRAEPVEGRGVLEGDSVTLDLIRRPGTADAPTGDAENHSDVRVELGSSGNPPGLDEQLIGLEAGTTKTFTLHYPDDYPSAELAGSDVTYTATVKSISRKVLPELDDEFAKDVGDFASLDALRARVREDLEHEARHAADRDLREGLMKQLAARLPFDVPASLIEREMDRRLDEFARRLADQGIDPRRAGLDWQGFRESQRTPATEAVASALVLDELARRERLEVAPEELTREIERHAERTGRTATAVRAALEREGGLSRVSAGLRREKSIDFAMSRATIANE